MTAPAKPLRIIFAAALIAGAAIAARAADLPAGLPDLPTSGPALCVGDYLTSAQGRLMLEHSLAQAPTREAWEARAGRIRANILAAAGLDPFPRRTPLNPVIRDRRERDGYTVENVAIETIPGFYLTGNLYRPARPAASFPVVLCPHGHSRGKLPEAYDDAGRFAPYTQARAAALARMGAVVFAYEMFGWGETAAQVGYDAHRTVHTLPIQLWNSIRALDFLLALPGADPARVGVTGESGGGTQTFLLTAVDPRVTVSAPCVMVSSFFFGGCHCESGRPIHRTASIFTTNAEIAALAAPRPMLVISDGADWTRYVPVLEFPYLQKIYALCGAPGNVENAHFADEKHDYGPSKRAALYPFFARHLGLDLAAVTNPRGEIDESWFTPAPAADLCVFTKENPLPENALRSAEAVESTLHALQETQPR